jgi:hypothetical protein
LNRNPSPLSRKISRNQKSDQNRATWAVTENLLPQFRRQIVWGYEIHSHAEQLFQVLLQRAEIEQGRTGQRVDENVEVAPLLVSPQKRRTEDARIGRPKPSGRYANRVSMKSEGD